MSAAVKRTVSHCLVLDAVVPQIVIAVELVALMWSTFKTAWVREGAMITILILFYTCTFSDS